MAIANFVCTSFSLFLSWVVVQLVYALWWKPKRVAEFFKKQGIGGPPYQLLYGNTKHNTNITKQALAKPMELSHQIGPRVMPFILRSMNHYGKVFVMWHGRTARVVVARPEIVKQVLSSRSGVFRKATPPFIKLFGVGLPNLEAEIWAAHRRIINPAFQLEKLKGMFPEFCSACQEWILRLHKLVDEQLDGCCELDVWVEMQKLTADLLSRAAFGSNYEEGKLIFQYQKEQTFLLAKAMKMIDIPGMRFMPTTTNIRGKKLSAEVRSLLMNLITKRMNDLKIGEVGKVDLLGTLLKAHIGVKNEVGEPKKLGTLSMDDIIGECKFFYFAGHETTSVLLTWTMVVLSMHPEWQDRAREEVLRLCAKEKPTFEKLNQLKTVTMILNEVLRLYPPAALMLRRTCKQITLGEINLPAGVQVFIPTILIHHDKETWGDDADEFNPWRFSNGIPNVSDDRDVGFFPFGWGPRTCIGQMFAMVEAKLALAMILQHFSFQLSPSYVHAPHIVISLQPQHGAQLILRRI